MLPDPEHNHSQSIYFPSSARSWQGLGKASEICFVAGFISSLSLCAGQACHFSAPLALLLSCPVFHNVEGGHRWQHHVLLGTTLGYTPVWYIFLSHPENPGLISGPCSCFFCSTADVDWDAGLFSAGLVSSLCPAMAAAGLLASFLPMAGLFLTWLAFFSFVGGLLVASLSAASAACCSKAALWDWALLLRNGSLAESGDWLSFKPLAPAALGDEGPCFEPLAFGVLGDLKPFKAVGGDWPCFKPLLAPASPDPSLDASGVFKIIGNPFESMDTSEIPSSPSQDLSTSMSLALSQASSCSSMAPLHGSSGSRLAFLAFLQASTFELALLAFLHASPCPGSSFSKFPSPSASTSVAFFRHCLLLSGLFFSLRQWLKRVIILLLMELAQTLCFMSVSFNVVNLSTCFFNGRGLGMPSHSGKMPLSHAWHSIKPWADGAWATSRVL